MLKLTVFNECKGRMVSVTVRRHTLKRSKYSKSSQTVHSSVRGLLNGKKIKLAALLPLKKAVGEIHLVAPQQVCVDAVFGVCLIISVTISGYIGGVCLSLCVFVYCCLFSFFKRAKYELRPLYNII